MGPDVYINEVITDDQGTISTLNIPAYNWNCFINELPERNNERCFSRIPRPAVYNVRLVDSKKFGRVYLIENVPDRSAILMHAGNYAGDTRKKYRSDVLGCQEFGKKVVIMEGQRAVINSRSTRDEFMQLLNGQNFKLHIS
jgi:hypothetical protein